MIFGERLVVARKERRLSAEQVAQLCGVSRSYITLIENGRRLPGKKILPKIAEVLGVEMSMVMSWYLDEVREKLIAIGEQ